MARTVTPFVGVWIETYRRLHPDSQRGVTPFVGVWIETSNCFKKLAEVEVTPFVGVWIETEITSVLEAQKRCHTLRGCVD